MIDYEPWSLPEELEPYRQYLENEEYPLDRLMQVYFNEPDIKGKFGEEFLYTAISVSAKIRLLNDLIRHRKLTDLSTWVCRNPITESNNFCGGPGKHPEIWGCGFQKVE